MIYQFRPGSRVPAGADPDKVGKRLERLRKQAGLTIETLADEAEANPGDAILGPWFEWDNELCVRKYHEIQAGTLIRSVFAVEVKSGQSSPVRAFVVTNDNGDSRYERIDLVIGSPDRRGQLIDQVAAEKRAVDEKWNELIELVRLA